MKKAELPKGTNNTQSTTSTTSTLVNITSTTTKTKTSTLSALAAPFQSANTANNDILPTLVEEQRKAARDLESYIAEFAHKVDNLQTRLSDVELVILFVMNLQPRWKRLVEPLEPTFATWTEAARAARYHSAKMSALLCTKKKSKKADEADEFAFFRSKKSEKLLTSGYFVPDNHPRKADFAGREQPYLKSTGDKSPGQKKKKADITTNGTAATSKATATSTKKVSTPQKQHSQLSVTANDFIPSLSPQGHGGFDISEEDGTAQVYDQVPPAHQNVWLPFLELNVHGRKVVALLAKNRWGASVMTAALLKKLNLPLDPIRGYDIGTDFGFVTASIGSTFLPLDLPDVPGLLLQPLEVQVVHKLYGGKVDLILGADFFFCYDALFTDVENRKLKLMNRETTFIAKVLK